MQVIPGTPCLITGLGLGSGVLLFGSTSAPCLGSGLLPLEYSAEVLFERREELLVAKRSARMFVGTQSFDILVRHQAVRPSLKLVRAALLHHQFEVVLVILVARERRLAAVSPLGDVVRQTGCDNSCQSGHVRKISRLATRRQLIVYSVPGTVGATIPGT